MLVQPSKIKRGPFQKPPIRFALADLNDEPTSVSTVPSAVKVPRGHRKGQPSFEWADKKFFVVVAEDEDGHHCAVSAQRHVCPRGKAFVRNQCLTYSVLVFHPIRSTKTSNCDMKYLTRMTRARLTRFTPRALQKLGRKSTSGSLL